MNIQIDKIPINFLDNCIKKLPNDPAFIKEIGSEIRFMYDNHIILFEYDNNEWKIRMNTRQSVPDEEIPFPTIYPIPTEYRRVEEQYPCYDIVVPCQF